MLGKIIAFFTGFFGNVKADPVSSAKGAVQLAAAGATAYGMATGVVPINVGAPMAASFAVSGVHALGTNSATGVELPAAAKAEAILAAAPGATTTVLSVVDQVAALKAEADDAQKKIEAFQAIEFEIAKVLPPTGKQ